ncbi:MAG TPA: ABC transporter permease [Solirubrobacteraceae bacterium]
MTALLSAELLKLRTTRTFAAMAGTAIGISLLIVVLVAAIDEGFSSEDAADLLLFDTSSFFICALGAVGITGEWRHRTITSSLLAAPARIRFLVAKLLAYAVAGALLSAVITLAVALVTTLILSGRGEETAGLGDVVAALWRNALVAALLGALGVAIGSVIRNQVGAIVTILVSAFIVEQTLAGVAPSVGKYSPLLSAPAAIRVVEDEPDLLDPGVAVLVELGWIGVLAAIGAYMLRARDL